MGAVRFSIDSGLVRELKAVLPLKVFVETGTYEGDSVRAALPFFDELHTIELSAPLYARAADAFEGDERVHVHHGRSEDVLRELAPKLRRKSALYWLDAHWCDEKSEGGEEQCPLLEELEAIGSLSERSVVLIDDARLFLAPPPMPATAEGWPELSDVLERLSALSSTHELLVIDDVFVFFPPKAADTLRDYARHHAVDWLVELQAGRRVGGQVDRLRSQVVDFRDQVANQQRERTKQLNKKIGALGSNLEALESEVRSLGARVLESQQAAGEAPAELGELPAVREEIRSVGQRLDPVSSELESLSSQVGELAKELRAVRGRSRETLSALDEFPEARAEIHSIEQRLDPLGAQLDSLAKMVEALEQHSTASAQALGELPEARAEIRSLGERLGTLEERSTESAEALGELPEARGEIRSIEQRLEPLGAQLDSLAKALEALKQGSTESAQALGELPEARAEIRSLDQRLDPLDAQLESLGSLLEGIRSEVTGVQTELREVGAHSDESRAALDELPEALGEALGRVLGERVNAFKAELAELQPVIDKGMSRQSRRTEVTLRQIGGLREQVTSLEAQLEEMGRRRRPIRALRQRLSARRRRRRSAMAPAPRRPGPVRRRVRRRWRLLVGGVKRRTKRVRLFIGRSARRVATRLWGARLGSLDHHPPRELRIPRRYRRISTPEQAPRISIVTASDDRAAFLDRTIQSVLEQDYEPLEYIVEDSAATEETAEVLERYQDRLAHSEGHRNGGPATALNLGFDHATGDVMSYVRSDALLLPGALPYVARYFERHPEVDVVYGHRVLVDAEDNEIGRWVLPRHKDEVLSWADYVPQETLFWRRHVWEAAGGEVDEDLNTAMDWELLLRFREVGARMARVPRFLGAIRVAEPQRRAAGGGPTNGDEELDHLRSRVHGRQVSDEEASRAVRGYMRRHVMLQKLYRLHLLRY